MGEQRSTTVSWHQLDLLSDQAVEITIRIGILPDQAHCQFQVESTVPGSGRLSSLWARPHTSCAEAHLGLAEVDQRLQELLHEHLPPF